MSAIQSLSRVARDGHLAVAFLNGEVADDHRRLRRAERRPGPALVHGHPDPAVPEVEHVRVVRVLLDVEDRVAHAARDVRPGPAEVLRDEQPGRVLAVRPVPAEPDVARVLVEGRGHDALHPPVVRNQVALDPGFRPARRVVEPGRDVRPVHPAVHRHLHVPVVGARPVEAGLPRRLGEGVHRRPLQVRLAGQRDLLLVRLREIRADPLERAGRPVATPHVLAREATMPQWREHIGRSTGGGGPELGRRLLRRELGRQLPVSPVFRFSRLSCRTGSV